MPERPVSHQQKEREREKKMNERERERERPLGFPALAQILAAPATKAK